MRMAGCRPVAVYRGNPVYEYGGMEVTLLGFRSEHEHVAQPVQRRHDQRRVLVSPFTEDLQLFHAIPIDMGREACYHGATLDDV